MFVMQWQHNWSPTGHIAQFLIELPGRVAHHLV